jgi:quinoprotein glucose dehydrogenase
VIVATVDARLHALDASNGRRCAGFAEGGSVDLRRGLRNPPFETEEYEVTSPPAIVNDLIVVGSGVADNNRTEAASGEVRAFDARTGRLRWSWDPVPQDSSDPGWRTWTSPAAHRTGAANAWSVISVDSIRGMVFVPTSSASPDYFGGERPGENRYANSLVALDARTGRVVWHFQTVHHDLWDSDMPSPPALIDVVRDGQRIPALASVGKTGYMFILNRVTGEPIFGVEERPVPRGTVPGEWYAPTQPFPIKPARPLARVSFDKDQDMVRPEDTSAQHVAECQALWDKSGGFFNAGPFTPFSFHVEGEAPRSTIQYPGGTGGVNWGGAAVNPATGYVFVNTHDTSLVGWIEAKRPGLDYGRGTEGSTIPYDRGSVNGAGPYFTFSAPLKDETGRTVANLPCQRPPWGRLVAVNANTGEIAWETPLGLTEALPDGKQLTGNSGSAGPTATAGGLVFVGATTDRRFRAFDAQTGAELWSAQLAGQVNANPLTFRGRDGKQYVAVVATDALVAFALP